MLVDYFSIVYKEKDENGEYKTEVVECDSFITHDGELHFYVSESEERPHIGWYNASVPLENIHAIEFEINGLLNIIVFDDIRLH